MVIIEGHRFAHDSGMNSPSTVLSSPPQLHQSVEAEELGERVPKLLAHGAIQNEVNCGVEQSHEVHQVGQRDVAGFEESISQNAR